MKGDEAVAAPVGVVDGGLAASAAESRTRLALLITLIALTYAALFPPTALDGRYSILEVALVFVAGALLLSPKRRLDTPLAIPVAFALLMIAMLASTLWSVESWTSLRDAASYVLLAAGAWLVVSRGGAVAIVWGIAVSTTAIAVVSIAYWVIDPESATFLSTSALQGVFGNRNALGFVLAGGLPALLALPVRTVAARVGQAVAIVFVIVTALATTSQTTLVTVGAVLATWGALIVWRRYRWALAVFGGVVAAGAVVAALNGERILATIGKSSTLNGRTEIWLASVNAGLESPLIGYGWSRSWQPGSPHSLAVSDALEGTVVYHAHNELLNWFVTLGMVGVALVVLTFVTGVICALAAVRAHRSSVALWPALALVAIIVRGLTEISETNAQGWFVFSLAIFAAVAWGANSVTPAARRLVFTPARAVAAVGPQ